LPTKPFLLTLAKTLAVIKMIYKIVLYIGFLFLLSSCKISINHYIPVIDNGTYSYRTILSKSDGIKIDTLRLNQRVNNSDGIKQFYWVDSKQKEEYHNLSYSIFQPGAFHFEKGALKGTYVMYLDELTGKTMDDYQEIFPKHPLLNNSYMIVDSSLTPHYMDFDTTYYKIVSIEDVIDSIESYKKCLKVEIVHITPERVSKTIKTNNNEGQITNILPRTEIRTLIWFAKGVGMVKFEQQDYKGIKTTANKS
jgi:hypothetical protein